MNDSKKKDYEMFTVVISLSFVAISLITSFAYYSIVDRKLMAENIETAISKGVDPLAVRCSYANSQDLICVAFAATSGHHSVSSNSIKK